MGVRLVKNLRDSIALSGWVGFSEVFMGLAGFFGEPCSFGINFPRTYLSNKLTTSVA